MSGVTGKHSDLDRTAPWGRRFKAYLDERFPLGRQGLLIVSYYSSNQFLAHALTHPGEPMHYTRYSLLGAVTLLCFFFHLRVFDEHKDYREDNRYYPDRVLQRGLITLRDLKILGVLCIAIEFLMGGLRGPGALAAVFLTFLFSLLMLKEFFIRPWLKRHFLVYAVSHMLIMPLLALMVFSFATGAPPWEAPGWFWLYAWVGFFVAFNWEISRKIRAPEEEREGVDSYTKVFGTYGAAYMVLLMRVVDTAMVAVVGFHLRLPAWFYVFLILLFLVCMTGFLQYRFHTTPGNARRMETYAGFYIVAFDIALAVALLLQNGIRMDW
jgi:4-hydroxybenzoate polyprenyltransferase